MNARTTLSIAIVMIGLCSRQPAASAAAYIFNFGSLVSGGASAPGGSPWLTAQFTDVAPGEVQMTFTAANLTGRESVRDVYLNLNPALNPCLLVFNRISSVGSFRDPRVGAGANAFRPDHLGEFDIRIRFGCGLSSGGAFGPGEQITYLITGIPGLNASSFDFTSAPNCRSGSFYAASQVRGIVPPRSSTGWVYPAQGLVPVPEPGAPVLFALALIFTGVARRWRGNSN